MDPDIEQRLPALTTSSGGTREKKGPMILANPAEVQTTDDLHSLTSARSAVSNRSHQSRGEGRTVVESMTTTHNGEGGLSRERRVSSTTASDSVTNRAISLGIPPGVYSSIRSRFGNKEIVLALPGLSKTEQPLTFTAATRQYYSDLETYGGYGESEGRGINGVTSEHFTKSGKALQLFVHPRAGEIICTIKEDNINDLKIAISPSQDPLETMECLYIPLNEQGWLLTHFAAANDAFSVMNWLFENGANFTLKTNDNLWTPMHCAAYNQKERMCSFLRHINVDYTIEDEFGDKPSDIARMLGNDKLAEILGDDSAARAKKEQDEAEYLAMIKEAKELEQERERQRLKAEADKLEAEERAKKRAEKIKRKKELRGILETERLSFILTWLQKRQVLEFDALEGLEWLMWSCISLHQEIEQHLIMFPPTIDVDAALRLGEEQKYADELENDDSGKKKAKGKKSAKKAGAKKKKGGKKASIAVSEVSAFPDFSQGGGLHTLDEDGAEGEGFAEKAQKRRSVIGEALSLNSSLSSCADEEGLELPSGVMTKEKKKEVQKLKNRLLREHNARKQSREEARAKAHEEFVIAAEFLSGKEATDRKALVLEWFCSAIMIKNSHDPSRDATHPGFFGLHAQRESRTTTTRNKNDEGGAMIELEGSVLQSITKVESFVKEEDDDPSMMMKSSSQAEESLTVRKGVSFAAGKSGEGHRRRSRKASKGAVLIGGDDSNKAPKELRRLSSVKFDPEIASSGSSSDGGSSHDDGGSSSYCQLCEIWNNSKENSMGRVTQCFPGEFRWTCCGAKEADFELPVIEDPWDQTNPSSAETFGLSADGLKKNRSGGGKSGLFASAASALKLRAKTSNLLGRALSGRKRSSVLSGDHQLQEEEIPPTLSSGCEPVVDHDRLPYHAGQFRYHLPHCKCGRLSSRDYSQQSSIFSRSSSVVGPETGGDSSKNTDRKKSSVQLNASSGNSSNSKGQKIVFCNPGGFVWSCCGSQQDDSDGCTLHKRFIYSTNKFRECRFRINDVDPQANKEVKPPTTNDIDQNGGGHYGMTHTVSDEQRHDDEGNPLGDGKESKREQGGEEPALSLLSPPKVPDSSSPNASRPSSATQSTSLDSTTRSSMAPSPGLGIVLRPLRSKNSRAGGPHENRSETSEALLAASSTLGGAGETSATAVLNALSQTNDLSSTGHPMVLVSADGTTLVHSEMESKTNFVSRRTICCSDVMLTTDRYDPINSPNPVQSVEFVVRQCPDSSGSERVVIGLALVDLPQKYQDILDDEENDNNNGEQQRSPSAGSSSSVFSPLKRATFRKSAQGSSPYKSSKSFKRSDSSHSPGGIGRKGTRIRLAMDKDPDEIDSDEEERTLTGKLHEKSMSDWHERRKREASSSGNTPQVRRRSVDDLDSDEEEELLLNKRLAASRRKIADEIRMKEAMERFDEETGQNKKESISFTNVPEALYNQFLGGDFGIGWWANTTQVRGLGINMEAPEPYGAGDLIGIVVDGVNQEISFYKNRIFAFSIPGIIGKNPEQFLFVPAVTMVAGSVVACDLSYHRTALVYADVSMRNRATEERAERMGKSAIAKMQKAHEEDQKSKKKKRKGETGMAIPAHRKRPGGARKGSLMLSGLGNVTDGESSNDDEGEIRFFE